MKLIKLKLENFLTYEELEYNFEDKALLVQGINLTDKNQKSNGSGKSAIQTGIEFALTASNSRGVNDVELVTYGFDKSKVQLFIECESRKETLEIEWTIKTKGSNLLSLKINENELSFSNVNDGKKQILNWLGISKEDLFNYFIINSTRFKSFFGSSNREKVDLINRFSDSSIIDGLENIDNSQFDSEKVDIENKINRAEGGIEIIVNQIDEAKNINFEDEFNKSKDDLESQISVVEVKIKGFLKTLVDYKNDKIEVEKDIQVVRDEIKEIEDSRIELDRQIDKEQSDVDFKFKTYNKLKRDFENIKFTNFKDELSAIEDNVVRDEKIKKDTETNISKINKFIEGLDVKLSGKIDCPKCSHTFVLDGDIEIMLTKKSQGEDLLKKYNNALVDIEDSLEKLSNEKIDIHSKENVELVESRALETILSDARKTFNDFEDTLSSTKRKSLKIDEKVLKKTKEIEEFESELKEIIKDEKFIKETRVPYLESNIKDLEKDINNLKLGGNKDAIKKLKSSIKIKEEELIELNRELITVNDTIYNRNKWSNNFKQFRLHLANKSLETMQYRTNHFLKELGNDILVRLDGYKVKANGTIKEEISAVIIRDGERTFSSLSGGEQVRVLFSSILANRYLINSTHPHGGLDFLSVDEVFDKIDSVGMKHLIRSAKKLETCIMVISHVSDEDLSGEDILTIVKENGVSTIKQ